MTGFTTIWFKVRVEPVEIYIFNQFVLMQLVPTTYVPRSGTNLVLSTLRMSRRCKISNLSWNSTRFANLCCYIAVQATTTNTSFGVTEVTPVVLWKRTFFRKVVVRAGCRNLAHTSSTLSIVTVFLQWRSVLRLSLHLYVSWLIAEIEIASCTTYLPEISPRSNRRDHVHQHLPKRSH